MGAKFRKDLPRARFIGAIRNKQQNSAGKRNVVLALALYWGHVAHLCRQ